MDEEPSTSSGRKVKNEAMWTTKEELYLLLLLELIAGEICIAISIPNQPFNNLFRPIIAYHATCFHKNVLGKTNPTRSISFHLG